MTTAAFVSPRTLPEALALLAAGGWSVLAGGTDVYPAHVGRPITTPLLDITRIAGLRGVREEPQGWRIGAATTWSDIVHAPLPPLFDALKAAARDVGGMQIQNTGTLAGNVCNASPAADGMPVLLALDAQVELSNAGGQRCLPLHEFVLGSRKTARAPNEMVTALLIPKRNSAARSCFAKLGGRRYLVISIVMVGITLDVDAAGCISYAGIAVGSCSAVAQRLPVLEQRLLGLPLIAACDVPVAFITARDLSDLTPIDDIRASAAYRRDATITLLQRALASCAGHSA